MIITYFFICAGLAIFYVLMLLGVLTSWQSSEEFKSSDSNTDQNHQFSIIIAARNEESNIRKCIESILASNFPKDQYEIIVVDDHSKDQTTEMVSSYADHGVRLLQLDSGLHGKKAALSHGVEQAKHEWIVTTDADCTVTPTWLLLLDQYISAYKKDFVAMPVVFEENDAFFHRFQSCDLLGTMGATLHGIKSQQYHMANGANMAFKKSMFQRLKNEAYESNDIASGDDMFLIQNIALENPRSVSFLKSKEAAVTTKTEPTVSGFIRQRIRWASKSSAYPQKGIYNVLVPTFLINCSILLNLILAPFTGFLTLFIALFQMLCKWAVDYLYLYQISEFFGRARDTKWYIFLAPLHMLHIIFSGFVALLPFKVDWKGRKV